MSDAPTPLDDATPYPTICRTWHNCAGGAVKPYPTALCSTCLGSDDANFDARAELSALRARVEELEAALGEALEGWGNAALYKGEYFIEKHGDAENIARLRAALSTTPPEE
jgi:hypothetical protein